VILTQPPARRQQAAGRVRQAEQGRYRPTHHQSAPEPGDRYPKPPSAVPLAT